MHFYKISLLEWGKEFWNIIYINKKGEKGEKKKVENRTKNKDILVKF